MDLQQRQLWNEDHKRLTSIIQKPTEHEKTIEIFLNQHALLYSSKMGNSEVITVSNNDQVLDSGEWNKKLKIDYIHSGNEMSEMEVAELSTNIDINALLSYRIEVARKTRAIIKSLQPGQFKQSVESVKIKKQLDQGAVKKEATWLLEYWGKKNIAGLILMPATRHNFLHLNKSIRIKNKIQK